MKRGHVYMVSLDPSKGKEQQGDRPVLVVSATAFNQTTLLPVVCPITNGGDFVRRIGFAVPLLGCKTTGVVRCDQPRVLDLNERRARLVETLPLAIMDEVLAKLIPIFE